MISDAMEPLTASLDFRYWFMKTGSPIFESITVKKSEPSAMVQVVRVPKARK